MGAETVSGYYEQSRAEAEHYLAMDVDPLEGEWPGPDTEALRIAYDAVAALS